MTRALGLDFGTTNTVMAVCDDATGAVAPVAFTMADEKVEALRSALCFWKQGVSSAKPQIEAGPWAIAQYIAHPDESRFMQSLKTFAASPFFEGTYAFGKRYRFEELLNVFFDRILSYAGGKLETKTRRLVVGRPVTFAGASPDPALATKRYDSAFQHYGFSEILFVYEPVAAAFFFARTLKKSAKVLVADFGGGTTDYSIINFDVSKTGLKANPLAHGGVGLAGDTFDYRIIDHVILPHLGKGTQFRSMGKVLDMPQSIFASFARWNLLSVLKSSDEFRKLKDMLRTCLEPDKLQRFIDLVEDDQGYPLYKAISAAKAELSSKDSTEFSFPPLGKGFHATITRQDFEGWIAHDLMRMEQALDETLIAANLKDQDIDKVFLTGGTSFVPAVRAIFERRYGTERIEAGSELLSIANGLALIGERDDAAAWSVTN